MRATLACLALLAVVSACSPPAPPPADSGATGPLAGEPAVAPDIEERLARFAPTRIEADLSALSPDEIKVLALVVRASRFLDDVFLRQAWAGNPDLAARIAAWKDAKEAPKAAAWQYFQLNFGPWDRLESMEPFLGDAPHPPGAGFYPEDLSREEMEGYLAAHPEQKEELTSTVTVVRRDGDSLVAVPYSEAYREWLAPSADLLRNAAAATANDSLRRFLELRADAFASDDYYESDFAWMDLDAPVEVTIGPYETYEDELFGYKASFESFVTVALPAESEALAGFKNELPWLERSLPIPDEDKNFNRGTDSPIRVVDLVATAGDAAAGVMTLAFNLPNDERVREAKGSKKVLMRNVMRAKYEQILVPIAERVLAADQVGRVAFAAYFNEVLHHELAHGLGPGKIVVAGRPTEVRLELKELYSTLEEAKADVMGVYDILALVDKGAMDREFLDTLEPTYVAGLFRAARFGVGEAHGQGVVAQFNYLLEKGALAVDADGRFRSIPEKFPGAIRALLHDMLMLQARGDYDGTADFLARYGTPSASLLAAIERLADVPVDIRPIFAPVPEG